jgi:hypothetical protein
VKLGNGSDNNNKRNSKVQVVFSQAAECTLASSHQFGVWGRGNSRGVEVGIIGP